MTMTAFLSGELVSSVNIMCLFPCIIAMIIHISFLACIKVMIIRTTVLGHFQRAS